MKKAKSTADTSHVILQATDAKFHDNQTFTLHAITSVMNTRTNKRTDLITIPPGEGIYQQPPYCHQTISVTPWCL